MPSRSATVLALLLLSAPVAAEETKGVVTVFPFDFSAAQVDKGTRIAFEEGVRSAAAATLAPVGYIVLTGDTQLRLMQDNGVDPSSVCDANCSLTAAREIKATYFITGIVSQSEGEYAAFVRLFRAGDGKQLYSTELDGKTVKDLREAFKGQASALFAELLPRATVNAASTGVAPVQAASAPVPPKGEGHAKRAARAGQPDMFGRNPVEQCDNALKTTYNLRETLFASGSDPRYAYLLQNYVAQEGQDADAMEQCAEQFGPMYSYSRLAPKGEEVKRSMLRTPVTMSAAQCADLADRIGEFRAAKQEYVSGSHADDLNAPQQAQAVEMHIPPLQELQTKYCKGAR